MGDNDIKNEIDSLISLIAVKDEKSAKLLLEYYNNPEFQREVLAKYNILVNVDEEIDELISNNIQLKDPEAVKKLLEYYNNPEFQREVQINYCNLVAMEDEPVVKSLRP